MLGLAQRVKVRILRAVAPKVYGEPGIRLRVTVFSRDTASLGLEYFGGILIAAKNCNRGVI